MKKLIPLLLLVPLLIAGCTGGPITRGGQLSIISFNAEPSSISAGESSNLSWNVSGATTITIDQGVGNVALTGTRAVTPAATTVYTITAYGSSGSATATTQVVVTGAAIPVPEPTPTPTPTPAPSATGLPDLVIQDIANSSGTITYTVENQGDAAAGPSTSTLLVDGATVANDNVGSLAPGESRTESFSGYTYSCTDPGDDLVANADTGNTVVESSEANNSFAKSWSCTFTILPIQAVMLQPDLTVEDIWVVHEITGDKIYYRIKNNGSIAAAASTSYLHIYPCKSPCKQVASDDVAQLNAGESRTEKFASYNYIGLGSSVEVKVDATSAINESDEDNNSLSKPNSDL
jgi:hypothetical protein